DYDYGSALGVNRAHPSSESAIPSASVGGNSPMNSLCQRTEFMLDCSELLAPVADLNAATAMRDAWFDSLPALLGRHPDEEEPEDGELDEDDDLDEDFDDEDDEFDDEDFDDDEDEDIDEDLDDEIDDIDVEEEEEEDFDDDEELDEIGEDEDEDDLE